MTSCCSHERHRALKADPMVWELLRFRGVWRGLLADDKDFAGTPDLILRDCAICGSTLSVPVSETRR